MRFNFRANPTGGIRLISEIADYRLCWLEGRNGIGKTLAVRLLELISGEQPYASAPAAWRSLRKNLGPTTVTVTGLKGGEELVVDLTPGEWPEEPVRGVQLGICADGGKDSGAARTQVTGSAPPALPSKALAHRCGVPRRKRRRGQPPQLRRLPG